MKQHERSVYDNSGQLVGTFDGEVVYINGKPAYRVDGDEVYTFGPRADFIGHFANNFIMSKNSSILYELEY